MKRPTLLTIKAHPIRSPRYRGAVPIPVVATLVSMLAGAATGLGLAFTIGDPWFAVVIGFCATIVVGMSLGAIYYRSDYARYMKIRHM